MVQLHLVLNHISLIGIPLSIVLLMTGYFMKNDSIKKVAAVFCVVLALAVIPAYSSGEGAEDAIENYPGISHSLIDRHEQSAEVAFALSMITGGIAVFSLLVWNTGLRNYMLIGVFVTASLATISLGIAAHSGGQIRHSELRNSSAIDNAAGPVERGDE